MTNRTVFLTTLDNPYDPVEQWREWYNFDMIRGYGSCEYLARIAKISDQFSDEEASEEIERAIDEIVRFNPLIYRKLEKEVKVA